MIWVDVERHFSSICVDLEISGISAWRKAPRHRFARCRGVDYLIGAAVFVDRRSGSPGCYRCRILVDIVHGQRDRLLATVAGRIGRDYREREARLSLEVRVADQRDRAGGCVDV